MPTLFSASAEAIGRRRILTLGFAGLGSMLVSGCTAGRGEGPRGEVLQGSPSDASQAVKPSASSTAAGSASVSSARRIMSRNEAIAKYSSSPAGSFGLDVKGIELGLPAKSKGVALSFDACGGARGSGVDKNLLAILRSNQVPATLFINQRWARSNTALMRELSQDPLFEIANHGTSHLPLSVAGQSAYGISGTASVGAAYDEIIENQRFLAGEYGVEAKFFRSGTAHMDQVGAALCRELGPIPMNFTVNLDAGATFPAATVAAQMKTLRAGDVGIGHFNQPASGTGKGVGAGLAAVLDRGLHFVKLADAFGPALS